MQADAGPHHRMRTKFVNTAADIPLITDRRIFGGGDTGVAAAAAKVRRINVHLLYCHECTAGPAWSSEGRAESDYLHHLNLVTSGEAECRFHDETIHLRPGNAYFFPGRTPLTRICRREFVSFLVVFRCEWFPGIDFLIDWPGRKPVCLGAFDGRLWRPGLSLEPETTLPFILRLESQIGLWLGTACPDLDAVLARHVASHARFDRVFAHVEANLSAGLRVSHLARIYGGSEQAFSLAFSRTTGLSPKAFIDRQINERVIDRLVSSDDGLQQIAAEWGFADQFQLSRFFKRLNGLPPTRYRADFRQRCRPASDTPDAAFRADAGC